MNDNTANLFKNTNTFVISKPSGMTNPFDSRILIQAVNEQPKIDLVKADEAKTLLFDAILNLNKTLTEKAQTKIKDMVLPGVCLNFSQQFPEETRMLLEDFQTAIKTSGDVEFMNIYNQNKEDVSKLFMVFDNNLMQIEEYFEQHKKLDNINKEYQEFLNLVSTELYALPDVFFKGAFVAYCEKENQRKKTVKNTKKKPEDQ